MTKPNDVKNLGDKEFEHKGEKFILSAPKDCALSVTGMGRTARVSVDGANYVIRVIDSNDNGQLYRPSSNLIYEACERIHRYAPGSEYKLCDHLTRVFDELAD